MTQKSYLEIRVGLFVLVGLLILVIFVFSIGDYYFYKPGYRLRVTFKSANAIVKGAPVQFAGVGVGKVDDIRVAYEGTPPQPHVELGIWIPQYIRVQADDRATISTFGLLGEKYLDIIPSYGKGQVLAEGDVLVGTASVSTEELTQQASHVLEQLGSTLDTVNGFFNDNEVRASLKGTLSNAEAMTQEWQTLGLKGAALVERLEQGVERLEHGEGSVGKFLYDQTLYDEVLALVREVHAHPWKLLHKPKDVK